MTIRSAPQMGHIAEFFVSAESLIFWPILAVLLDAPSDLYACGKVE
jgi:hypothetical protein